MLIDRPNHAALATICLHIWLASGQMTTPCLCIEGAPVEPAAAGVQEETRSVEDAGAEGVERRAAQVHQACLVGISWLRY